MIVKHVYVFHDKADDRNKLYSVHYVTQAGKNVFRSYKRESVPADVKKFIMDIQTGKSGNSYNEFYPDIIVSRFFNK